MREVVEMNKKMKMLTEAFDKKGLVKDADSNLGVKLEDLNPMKTYEELQAFNENLQEEQYFNRMVNALKNLGGKNERDITRKILTKLVDHELALNMNWSGRHGKPSFGTLSAIIRLIYVVIRSSSSCSRVSESETQNIIQIWLRNASDRQGGRMMRRLLKADAESSG